MVVVLVVLVPALRGTGVVVPALRGTGVLVVFLVPISEADSGGKARANEDCAAFAARSLASKRHCTHSRMNESASAVLGNKDCAAFAALYLMSSGMVLKDSKLLKTGLPAFKGQGLRRIRGSVLDVGGALPKESRK